MTIFDHAVILAAGCGRRMRPHSGPTPKQLLTGPGGQTMLELQVRWMSRLTRQVHVTVGYRKDLVAAEAIRAGASSTIVVDDLGNGAWITHSVLGEIDSPVAVVTCDNLMEIESEGLVADYERIGSPSAMLVPINPERPSSGDVIESEGSIVNKLTRVKGTRNLASGLQILIPASVRETVGDATDFADIWSRLIEVRQLHTGQFTPSKWIAVDSPEDLHLFESWADGLNPLYPL